MSKVADMSLCEEYAYVCKVSCDCESADVKLLGTYETDEKGFYVDIKCRSCGKVTQDGDGDFFDYYEIKDGKIQYLPELIPDLNSSRVIEVDNCLCSHCNNQFYEFKDYELETCPHCRKALDFKGSCYVEETVHAVINVDYKTGKLIVNIEQEGQKRQCKDEEVSE